MHFTSKDFSILVIIGPSGSGKSTAIRQLHQEGLVESVPTWTTRPPRPDELKQGIEHMFIPESEFRKKEKQGLILETRQMFGLPYLYGLPVITKPKDDVVPLIVLRASLIPLLAKHYSNYAIYQIEDSFSHVQQRLTARTIHGEDIGSRLDNFEEEIAQGNKLAKRTFINNESPEILVQKLKQAILKDFK
jgi:guanylate kinase